jgi:hypothetical protein
VAITATCRVLRVAVKRQSSLGNRERERGEGLLALLNASLNASSLLPIASSLLPPLKQREENWKDTGLQCKFFMWQGDYAF